MASGSFKSTETYGCYAHIEWKSIAGVGGSTVYADLYFKANYRYNFTFTKGYAVGIDNSDVYGNGAKITSAGDWLLKSHSIWIAYTGDKTVGISGYANCTDITNSSTGNKLPNYTVGGLANLDKVGSVPSTPTLSSPKKSYISETSTSITVSWSKSTSYNNKGNYHVDVSINGGAWSYVSGDIDIGTTSWTYKVPYKTQGTTYKFRVSCGNDIGWSGHSESGIVTINEITSGTMTVPTTFNPYVATQSESNSILPITFTKGSQSLDGTLYYKAQLYYGDALVSSTIFSSDKNDTKLNILIPSSTYAQKLGTTKYMGNFVVKAWLENQNGSKSSILQSTLKVDLNSDGGATPTLAAPVFSGGALSNASTCFIAKVSKLNVTSGAASARRAPSGTTLKYTIKGGNNETTNASTAIFDCWKAGVFNCTVTVTDSRGLSTSVTKQYVVQSYSIPRIVIKSSGRKKDDNTYATITYSLYYSPIYQYTNVNTKGNQLNGISIQQYSKNGSTSWTNYSSGTDITGLDTSYSYNFEVRVADKVKTTTYVSDKCIIPTIKSLMSMRSYGVGFGGIPQVGHSLEVTGVSQFNGNANITGILSTGDLLQIRGGSSSANKRLLDFGWSGGDAKYGVVLETNGDLRFSSYSSGGVETLYLKADSTIETSRNINLKSASHIVKGGVGSAWVNGRDNAMIRMKTISGYSPFASIKSTNGSWEIGTYDNNAYANLLTFSYVSDNNYNVGTNDASHITLNPDGTVSKARYLGTSNYIMGTSGEWMGFYNSSGTRKGWIGHDGGTTLHIQNEASSRIQFNTPVVVDGNKWAVGSDNGSKVIHNGTVVLYPNSGNTSVAWNPSFSHTAGSAIAGGNGDVNAFNYPLDIRLKSGSIYVCSTRGNGMGSAIRFNYMIMAES